MEMQEMVAQLRADVEEARTLAVRAVAMAQEVSESHDRNRRELAAAATRAEQLSAQLEQNISRVENLVVQLAEG